MKSWFLAGVVSGREDGAVLVFVVLAIALMFVGLTSLAVDSGHMVMVRAELQNAADAGALAGAGVLINPSDGTVNSGAITEADAVARENPAAGADRDSASTALDKLDVVVKIGHWSFKGTFDGVTVAENEFYEASSPYTQLANWETYSYGELNSYDGQGGAPLYINAVQVTTTREHTQGIFTNIFGWNDNKIQTDAVAYIGFAASTPPETVDIPFAVCKQFIMEDSKLSCGVARATNEGVETGGWTNFTQDSAEGECTSSSASDVNKDILADIPPCEDLNTSSLKFNKGIGTINGAVDSTFAKIVEHCFVDAAANPDCYQNNDKYNAKKPWLEVTLPVVDCKLGDFGGGTLACDDENLPYVGLVTLDIIWMSSSKDNVPVEYDLNGDTWTCSDTSIDWTSCSNPKPSDPALCWQEFQTHYGMNFADPNTDGLPEINTIYFAPGCQYVEPSGSSGNNNFGVQAKVPVLVE